MGECWLVFYASSWVCFFWPWEFIYLLFADTEKICGGMNGYGYSSCRCFLLLMAELLGSIGGYEGIG